jgi:uncharacterized membrane protein YuzA (DUF378 family)
MKISKYMTSTHLLRILIGLAALISLYVLLNHIYKKEYQIMNCWQFPMLLAILIELYV